jgi:hypothetical protein
MSWTILLACIEVLEIFGCLDLVAWPREVEGLQSLKVLYVTSCITLVRARSSAMFPPNLEKMCVHACHNLMELPNLTESLQEVVIMDCRKLRVCPSWTRRKPRDHESKLRMLSLSYCPDLK